MYFESAKRSGGDLLKEIEYNEGDEIAFLTYGNEEGNYPIYLNFYPTLR